MAMYPHSGMGPSGPYPPNMSVPPTPQVAPPEQDMQPQMFDSAALQRAQFDSSMMGQPLMGQGGIEQYLQPFLQQMQQKHQQEMQGKIQPYVQEVQQLTDETFPNSSSMQGMGGGTFNPMESENDFFRRSLQGLASLQGGLQGQGVGPSSFFNSPQYQQFENNVY
tara:strand:+ start:23 stop:517 length:495 start_codon:yes stop_codon:yes gene_type:complete